MPPLADADLTAAQRVVANAVASGPRGGVYGPFVALLRSPELMRRVQELGAQIRYAGTLDQRVFELTVLQVARAWDQQFEWDHHVPHALAAGLDRAVIEALSAGTTLPLSGEPLATTSSVVEELLRTRAVSDIAYDRAVAELGEPGFVELVVTVGYYAMLAMVMNAVRTAPPAASPEVALAPSARACGVSAAALAGRYLAASDPVVLLHPLGADANFWDGVAAAFADAPCYALDLPGHGRSAVPDAPLEAEQVATQVGDHLDERCIRPAAVVGLSLGGDVATLLAAARPDLVPRLMLADCVPVYPQEWQQRWQERAAQARAGSLAAIAEETLPVWFTAAALADDGPPVRYARARLATTPAEGYARACELLAGVDVRAAVAAVEVPTVAVCGADDSELFRDGARWFATNIRGARHVELPGTRHASALERPVEFAAVLRELLARGPR